MERLGFLFWKACIPLNLWSTHTRIWVYGVTTVLLSVLFTVLTVHGILTPPVGDQLVEITVGALVVAYLALIISFAAKMMESEAPGASGDTFEMLAFAVLMGFVVRCSPLLGSILIGYGLSTIWVEVFMTG